MINSFIYKDKQIDYYVDKGKRKNYYITIKHGEVVFKVPRGTPDEKVKRLIESKKDWIYNHLNETPVFINKKNNFENDEQFFLLGNSYPLNIEYKNIKRVKLNFDGSHFKAVLPVEFLSQSDVQKQILQKAFDKFYFNFAESKVKEIMKEFIEITNLEPSEWRIRNLKSSWGNCSSKSVICINKDVVKFSENAVRYVCLHELCHLKYMNHSKDFWNLVKQYLPNYKIYEEELKH